MWDVFISYKAEDRPRVEPLVDALEGEGLSVWWDARVTGGEAWREAIAEHLEAARCVIVVWSKRSTSPEGRFVRDEASRAQQRGTYLPITIDKVQPPLAFDGPR
jgi:serine/threonine-protein kinase